MAGVKGRSGRKPQPTAIRLLNGNAHPERIKADEPKPELLTRAPQPPATLDVVALREWNRIAPELVRLHLLSNLDLAALVGYCRAFSDAAAARVHIKRYGRYLKNQSGGFTLNPSVRDAHRAAELLRGFLVEFGMSPSSRARVVTGGGGAVGGRNGEGQEAPRPRPVNRLGSVI